MKANKKFIEDERGISTIVGLILMVAITVSIVATMYVIFNEVGKGEDTVNPKVLFKIDKNPSENTATLTITSVSEKVNWSDVSAYYICITNSTKLSNSHIEMPKSGFVSGTNMITLSDCVTNSEYRFTLSYDKTGGLMGTAEWTQ